MTRTMKAGSEAAFQVQVENLADFYGWRTFHAPDNRPITAKSGRQYVQSVKAGFPDLVLSRGPELIVAELKTEKGRLSKDQDAWLDAFREFARSVDDMVARVAGVPGAQAPPPVFEVAVWRPSMLQEITDRLSRPALLGVPGAGPDPYGVCPNCESAQVWCVRSTFDGNALGLKCFDCGTVWQGVRRKLAA